MSSSLVKPIKIPTEVKIEIVADTLRAVGPKGTLSSKIRPEISVSIRGADIYLTAKTLTKETKALLGTTRSLVSNIIQGVKEGYQKQLEIRGIGWKALLEGNKLILNVGFSHPVSIDQPEGIEFSVQRNIITVSGIDKQLVGETAAKIRAIRKPEPYKGKGIRYVGEEVRRKAGKKAAGTGA